MNQQLKHTGAENGFSLLELIIAMSLTLTILGIGSTVLSSGFKIRSRENSLSDAVADSQRALNIMSREIANAGFNLTTNGVVPGDSDATHIRIRSNLNHYVAGATDASKNGVIDAGEDVKYFINTAVNTEYLVRYDANAAKSTVLANKLDSLRLHYFSQKVTYGTTNCDISNASSAEVTPALAGYIVIALCVQLPAVGTASEAGHQQARNVLLVSDVTLRNASLSTY